MISYGVVFQFVYVLCREVSCRAVLCGVGIRCVVMCSFISRCTVLFCCAVWCCVVSHCVLLLRCVVSCRVTLCCVALCSFVCCLVVRR